MLISAIGLGIILKVGDQKFRIKIPFNNFSIVNSVCPYRKNLKSYVCIRGEGGKRSDESGLKH